MKVAILGTRGIPNAYGGFEQFATYFAEYLASNEVDVTVYNSSNHPYKENSWKGVKIVHAYDPESWMGSMGQFFYDLFCVLHTRRNNFDVILQLGYTSSSVWGFLMPKKSCVITNMDGLEWKRTKYSSKVQKFLKLAESWAIKRSDCLIADSKGIQSYIKSKYNKESEYIPYGASECIDANSECLKEFGLKANGYHLLIARMEPENNVETIIKGFVEAGETNLVVIGKYSNAFGQYLHKTYSNKVQFLGAIYDQDILNSLRFYSNFYFHGHSVGGTNPSLLEAMACSCLVVANDNEFNRAVLEEDALYFKTSQDVRELLKLTAKKEQYLQVIENNLKKVRNVFSFEKVHSDLLKLFKNQTNID